MSMLEKMGSLTVPGTGLDLTAGTTVATNVIDLGALAINGFGPGGNQVFIDLEVEIVESGADNDTYVFNFIVDDTEALTSGVYTILSIPMVGSDPRLKTAGGKIYSGEIPDQVWQMAKEGYRYFGLSCVLANVGGTAGVSVNCAITPSRPRTPDDMQVTTSPIALPS